jgi:ANTAR domain
MSSCLTVPDKGRLAERLGTDVNQAFALLRDQARNRNQRLSDVARAFVDGDPATSGVAGGSPQASRPGTGQPRPSPSPPRPAPGGPMVA